MSRTKLPITPPNAIPPNFFRGVLKTLLPLLLEQGRGLEGAIRSPLPGTDRNLREAELLELERRFGETLDTARGLIDKARESSFLAGERRAEP